MPMISFRVSDDLETRIDEASRTEGRTRWLIGVIENHLRSPDPSLVEAAMNGSVQSEPDVEHTELVKSYEKALQGLRDEVAFLKAELAKRPTTPGRPASVDEARKLAKDRAFETARSFDPRAVDRLLAKTPQNKAAWDE